eukprot:2309714-Pleurochrysis_carterae.AAC.1
MSPPYQFRYYTDMRRMAYFVGSYPQHAAGQVNIVEYYLVASSIQLSKYRGLMQTMGCSWLRIRPLSTLISSTQPCLRHVNTASLQSSKVKRQASAGARSTRKCPGHV